MEMSIVSRQHEAGSLRFEFVTAFLRDSVCGRGGAYKQRRPNQISVQLKDLPYTYV